MTTTLYGTRRSAGRPLAMTVTVGLHVAGLVFLWNTGGFQRLIDEMPHTTAFLVDEPRDEPPPTPTEFKVTREPVSAIPVALPDLVFPDLDTPTGAGALTGVVGDVPVPTPGAGVAETPPPVLTPLSWTARRSPDDLYPPASIRMSEEGVATVRVCVGPDAKLSGPPQVIASSGYPRLDQAAITWTREALVYRPATEDGRPVEACKGFKVTFDLK